MVFFKVQTNARTTVKNGISLNKWQQKENSPEISFLGLSLWFLLFFYLPNELVPRSHSETMIYVGNVFSKVSTFIKEGTSL